MKILALILLFVATIAHGAVYYVATNGLNANPGTLAEPWLTIQKGLDNAQPGDTVNVQPGGYKSGSTLNPARSGTAINLITIAGIGQPTIGDKLNHQYSWYLWTGFIFTNRFELDDTNCNNNILQSNIFEFGLRNVHVIGNNDPEGPSTNRIVNNEFRHWTGNAAVVVGRGRSNLIQSNWFHFNDGWDALRIWGQGTIIADNFFDRIGVFAGNNNHSDIMQTFGNGSTTLSGVGIIFERNRLYYTDCQLGILELSNKATPNTAINTWTYRNNILDNSRLSMGHSVHSVTFYNNTVYRSLYSVGFSGGYYSITNGAHNGRVYNNIFYDCGTSAANGTYGFNVNLTNWLAGYNFQSWNGTNAKTSANLVYAVNEINGGDPMFVNPALGDFRLQTNSPCRATGTNLSAIFTTDFNGATRGATWDMGALAFDPANQGTPPASTNALRFHKIKRRSGIAGFGF